MNGLDGLDELDRDGLDGLDELDRDGLIDRWMNERVD